MDEFASNSLNKTEEKYRKKIQEQIKYCLYCQPYDEGEAVWIYGDRVELNDLFDTLNIPKKNWDNIIDHLHCPNCGNTNFSITLDVGLKTKYEKELERHMEEVYDLYGSEVKQFEEELEKYPLLAFNNKFGKRIFKELKEKKLPIIELNGIFFRARKVESDEVINNEKMFCPPKGKPTEGRFNHAGQSHLYLASNKQTAIREVISENEKSVLVWFQEFRIEKTITKILDLSFDWTYLRPSTSTLFLSLKIFDSIDGSKRNIENWKPDYYLTRYIMDCAKSLGYNGIKYNSTKDNMNFNVVLFYPEKNNIHAIGQPNIEVFLNKTEIGLFNSDIFEI